MTHVTGLPSVLVSDVVHSNCVSYSFVFLHLQLYPKSYLTGPPRSGVHNAKPMRAPDNIYESLGDQHTIST